MGQFFLQYITVDDSWQDKNHSYCPTTSMKPHSSLSLLLIIGLVAFPTLLHAQQVTWGATGLPPGMTIGTNGSIRGTPTTPGNYTAVLFPKNGTAIGNMTSAPITILPTNASPLPLYFSYSRLLQSGNSFTPLAGGNGYALVEDPNGALLYTTNGSIFTIASLPIGTLISNGWVTSAAISGSRCLALGYTNDPTTGLSRQTLLYSDFQGAFKIPSTMLPGLAVGNQLQIASDSSRFYVASSSTPSTTTPQVSFVPNNANMNIFNPALWKGIQFMSRPGSSINTSSLNYAMDSFSVATDGKVTIFSASGYPTSITPPTSNPSPLGPSGISLFLGIVSNSIMTSQVVNGTQLNNPGIASVAYGNGTFIGTGQGGVWRSTNGIAWTKISSINVGQIIYSTPEKLFFTSIGGVSKDGTYWLPYGNISAATYSQPIISSQSGVIYHAGNYQLTTNVVPGAANITPRQATVGRPATF